MTGRRAESKLRNRQALLLAARNLFLSDGYHGISIQSIATEAGLTIGAIYSLFGSKQSLLHAVLDDLATGPQKELQVLAAQPAVDARTALTRYVRAYHDVLATTQGWRILRLEVEALTLLLSADEPEQTLINHGAGNRVALSELLKGRKLNGRPLTAAQAERASVGLSALLRGLAVHNAVEPEAAGAQHWVDLALGILEVP